MLIDAEKSRLDVPGTDRSCRAKHVLLAARNPCLVGRWRVWVGRAVVPGLTLLALRGVVGALNFPVGSRRAGVLDPTCAIVPNLTHHLLVMSAIGT